MSEEYQQNGMSSGGMLSDSLARLRLDTSKLLSDVECFLSGQRIVGYNEEGEPISASFGEPRMNQMGIQEIMNWLTLHFNSQTVQGNKDDYEYSDFIADFRIDISEELITNMEEYGLNEDDYSGVINKIVSMADMFFSRTIDNLERESYTNTFRSVERVGEQSGGWMQKINPFNK